MPGEGVSRRELLGTAAALGVAALAGQASGQESQGATAAPPAHFSFTKLVVGDLARSAAFYEATCGLTLQARVDTEVGGRRLSEILYQPTAPGGATFVLLHWEDTPRTVSSELILGFATSDLDAFVARAVASGGSVETAPYAIPEMKIRVAFVRDVEGHRIEVVEQTG
jgi:predicted enzyme related to lactoylglutathione lyase